SRGRTPAARASCDRARTTRRRYPRDRRERPAAKAGSGRMFDDGGLQPLESAMWACPGCQRWFANRNQSHACGTFELEPHFAGCDPNVRLAFERIVSLIRELGPVTVLPEKTRIAFQVRMSFAAVMPRKRWLDGHVVLARFCEHPRFSKIDYISPRNVAHHFRVSDPTDSDEEVRARLAEAYAVGEQRHLSRRGSAAEPTE